MFTHVHALNVTFALSKETPSLYREEEEEGPLKREKLGRVQLKLFGFLCKHKSFFFYFSSLLRTLLASIFR